MECPFSNKRPICDYAIEYEVLTVALDEAEELRMALNEEASSLRQRVHQLERCILDAGLTLPPKTI